MSMKPGATTRPAASISRLALPAGTRPTATIRSPRDRHVAVEPRVAGAIDDPAVADHQVVGSVLACRGGNHSRTGQHQRTSQLKDAHSRPLF